MAQEQIIFSSYCEDHLMSRFGTHKLKKTFEYFNPNYKLVVLGTKEIREIHKKYNVNYSNALPAIMLETKRKYDSTYVCHIDSDSLVLGWLREIVTLDYDIASCRNNCDSHTGDETQNRPQCIWHVTNNKYVNCGLTSTNSEKFLLEWIDLNKQITDIYGGVKSFWMADINWFNYLFHCGRFKSKILDENGTNLFYGPSANFDSGNNYVAPSITKEYGDFKNWSSWRDIKFENNEFLLDNKKVKILHKCGGGTYEDNEKIHWDLFNPEILPILKKITNEHN
jgi:hypothetical protein